MLTVTMTHYMFLFCPSQQNKNSFSSALCNCVIPWLQVTNNLDQNGLGDNMNVKQHKVQKQIFIV